MSHQLSHASPVQQQVDTESGPVTNSLQAPGAATQLKAQEAANNSPQVSQLRSLQSAANSSSQVQQLSALQNSANISAPVQMKPGDGGSLVQRDADDVIGGAAVGAGFGGMVGGHLAGPLGVIPGAIIGGIGGAAIGAIFGSDPKAFLAEIEGKTTAERQAILNDQTQMDAIRDKFRGNDLVLIMNALTEGSQKWQNPTGNNFYDHFVTQGNDTPVGTDTTMNCWESVLYAAFLAGEIDGDYIRNFYQTALAGGVNANVLIWQQLGYQAGLPEYPDTTPKAGQFLFYIEDGEAHPGHIALSHGGDEAMSLWWKPNNVDSVQRIQVNDLAGPNTKVLIADPLW